MSVRYDILCHAQALARHPGGARKVGYWFVRIHGKLTIQEHQAHIRPIVMISGGERARNFEQLVFQWIRTSLPEAHVRRLALTSFSLDDEAEIKREHAYYNFRPLHDQVERLCEVVEADPNLEMGFDVVAFGQGGLLARGYVQQCNHPQVHVLITYNTPHGGCSSSTLSQAFE